uniref:MH2 domain-containing protein n=1 Tax=Globodera rostochiensis TaxID=31243 RepID=A0A914HU07_GLORO
MSAAQMSAALVCGANVCGAQMSAARKCLRRKCPRRKRLRRKCLRRKRLRRNVCGANVRGANVCGANVCGANVCGANVCGANVCGANVCGARLRRKRLRRKRLRRNVCGANVCGAQMSAAQMSAAQTSAAQMSAAQTSAAQCLRRKCPRRKCLRRKRLRRKRLRRKCLRRKRLRRNVCGANVRGANVCQSKKNVFIEGRICLGFLSNVNRNATIENTRRHIGMGIRMACSANSVLLTNQSEAAVFVQSRNANFKYSLQPTAVCRVPPGATMLIFDYLLFAGMLEKAREDGYQHVYEIVKMCFVRLSFIKGWGADYPRQVSQSLLLLSTLHQPMAWIDAALAQMDPPDHNGVTSAKVKKQDFSRKPPKSRENLLNQLSDFHNLCSMQFKSKTQTAHINGRKHREAQLKQRDQQLKRSEDTTNERSNNRTAEVGLKRKQPPGLDASDSEGEKKLKRETDVVLIERTTVPWKAEVRTSDREKSERNSGANVIDGIPKGFFDDENMNNRVRETIEKQKQISNEIDRFYKEVEEMETQKEDEHEELAERSAIRSDIEMIDEQIERWKAVNELEKQKELKCLTMTLKSILIRSESCFEECRAIFAHRWCYYASLSIRARDPDARVLIITDEQESPYKRGPLSKELWWFADETGVESLSHTNPTSTSGRRRFAFYEADGFYLSPEELDHWEHGGVGLMRGAKVVRVNTDENFVELEDGRRIEFGKCLIATGSDALMQNSLGRISELEDHVTVLGKAADFRKIYTKMDKMAADGDVQNVVVVLGGGLLGTELAYSLNRRYARDREKASLKIVQLCYEPGVLSEILPEALSDYSTDLLRVQGIDVLTDTCINSATFSPKNLKAHQRKLCLNTKTSTINEKLDREPTRQQILCDHLIIALGAEPRVELADEKTGIKLDKENGGVMADEHLHRRRRCTHWQHAQITGRLAGENMTDGHKTYTHQGAFVTMFGPFGHICGVGDVNPHSLNTTTIMAKNERNVAEDSDDELRAVVLYTDPNTNIVSGVLLFNILGLGEEWARKLIGDTLPLNGRISAEYAKLFELWESESGDKKTMETKEENSGALTNEELEAYQRRED